MFFSDCIERKIFSLQSIIFELEDILNLNLYKTSQGCIFAKYCVTKKKYKNISWNFNIWLAEAEMVSWAPYGIQPTFRENLWPRQGEKTWQSVPAASFHSYSTEWRKGRQLFLLLKIQATWINTYIKAVIKGKYLWHWGIITLLPQVSKIEHMFLEEGRSVSISRNQDTMTCL